MSLPSSLLLPSPKTLALISFSPPNGPLFPSHNSSIKFPRNLTALSASSHPSPFPSSFSWLPLQDSDDSEADDFFEDEHVIGDCVVFEEGAFEDPALETPLNSPNTGKSKADTKIKPIRRKKVEEIKGENLVPEKWNDIVADINITKKERRKLAQEMEFGSKIERKKQGSVPRKDVDIGEYLTYREAKLSQLKPAILDKPSSFGETKDKKVVEEPREGRVAPKNPRWAVYGKGLEDVNEFFKRYDPTERNPEGRRKLFSKEEKLLVNMRVPDLAMASSGKWLPLHTLAASGEFYLMNILLKHKVDINVVDQNGLSALHKAITCKKQAITEYLLRESANPFVLDEGGATLMHYAVQTASSQAIKILLLYNVDINQPDQDGWTPLHLAVQTRRMDVVRLLLLKGADKTLRNLDGLTPLDLCLYSGKDTKTYELIKLLKQLPKQRKLLH